LKHANATFAGSAASPADFPRDRLPEVAFVGRSNVGKSSLLNALAGTRGLARVSGTPGRTRLVNFFRLTDVPRPGGRGSLYFVDLPGYGFAKTDRATRAGFERLAVSYLLDREPLRLVVFIVDARHEPSPGDQTLRAWLDHHRLPYLVAANKIDALGQGESRRRERALAVGIGSSARAVLGVSAERGTGIEELWRLLRAAAFAVGGEAQLAARAPAAPTTPPDPPGTTTAGDHGR
jgi:GTP-binding protein